MRQHLLGDSALSVSAFGFGCNTLGHIDYETSKAVIHRALDLGVTMFDTADVYGGGTSEQFLGRILGPRRKDVVVATKFGIGQSGPEPRYHSASRDYIMAAVEDSLRRLGTDYIDLYQSHFFDWETPLEETLHALDDLVRQGKIRAAGLCNHDGWQVSEAAWIARTEKICPVVSVQNEYNLFAREAEATVFPALEQHGIGFIPWSPLASGLLTGKYGKDRSAPAGGRLSDPKWKPLIDRTLTERNWSILADLTDFAEARGITLVELAYGWLNSRATVTSVIASATKVEQVEANVAAAAVELSADDIAQIDHITRFEMAPLPQRPVLKLRSGGGGAPPEA